MTKIFECAGERLAEVVAALPAIGWHAQYRTAEGDTHQKPLVCWLVSRSGNVWPMAMAGEECREPVSGAGLECRIVFEPLAAMPEGDSCAT